jgi:AraC-like DNA-binding protein
MSFVLGKSFWWEDGAGRIAVITASILLFVVQCVIHIIRFRKAYRNSVRQLELYYDEEKDNKIRWIRFCYIIMMLTQTFILVYLLLPQYFMKRYALWYAIFLVYFTANFISFLGSHKLLLDAFAYKALSGQEQAMIRLKNRIRKSNSEEDTVTDDKMTGPNEAAVRKLEAALDKWVKEKKFCEYDKSRDEVARELDTTREFLHMYFTIRKGIDFKTWRTELRIEEAKRLLLENKELSSHVIGEISGFSDRSNFHRQFVKFVGCSPKQWRDTGGKPFKG